MGKCDENHRKRHFFGGFFVFLAHFEAKE